MSSPDFRDLLTTALKGLNTIFTKVCEKKSSSLLEKSEFEKISNSIVVSFDRHFEDLTDKNASCSTSLDVLSRLNDLNDQFIQMKTDIFERFSNIEGEIGSLKPNVLSDQQSTSSIETMSYASVAKSISLPAQQSKLGTSTNSYASAVKLTSPTSDVPVLPAHLNAPLLLDSGSNLRKQKNIISGKNTGTGLMTVKRYPKRSAIFVSRLNPSTRSTDVIDFLSPLNLKHIVCTQIKTKYNTYASFHIEILDSENHLLLSESLWPEGSIVSKFYGRLKPDQILVDNNTASNTSLPPKLPPDGSEGA